MQATQPFPVTMRRLLRVLWRRRWTCVGTGIASVLLYHLVLLLFLSQWFTELPTYAKVYNVPHNILTIWRATPSWLDMLRIIDSEPVFEFGQTSPLFKAGKAVTWNYVATVHVIGDTGLIFLLLAAYITVLSAVREQARRRLAGSCPGLGQGVLSASVLSLIGAGTGAACCGAVSLGFVATVLGATATTVAVVARYELIVIFMGYGLLLGSLLHQGSRLYRLLQVLPAPSIPVREGVSSVVAPTVSIQA